MLRAIIFDFDGTILETELPDYLSWQEAYQEHNCELPLTLWLNAVGGSAADFDPYAHLETLVGRAVDRAQIRDRRRARMNALIAEQSIRPGLLATIETATRLGLRLGVASSSGREWIESHLEMLGIREHFEAVFTRADVVRVKPDPALYNMAVNALDVLPGDAVAIEDSRNGMLAAKAAGLRCVVVPNAVTQQSRFPEADLQMSSLDERPPEEWLRDLATTQVSPNGYT
jgi:HAD superfamily hydrolase (TIGR01509 family)